MERKTIALRIEEWKQLHREIPSILEVESSPVGKGITVTEKELSLIGVDVRDIIYVGGHFLPFQYIRDFSIFDLEEVTQEVFESNRIVEKNEKQMNLLINLLENERFSSFFSILDKRIKMPLFKLLYDDIPVEIRYGVFRGIYSSMEYNFTEIDQQFLGRVFRERTYSKEYQASYKKLKEKVNHSTITIYRGEETKSTPKEMALSWSLDKTVASFFSNRFGHKGTIYEAKVKLKDVLDYIVERNEEEILVYPHNVINLRKI